MQNGKFVPKRLNSVLSAIEVVRGRATVRTKSSVPEPRTKQECILIRGHSKCIMHVPAKFKGLSLFLYILEGKHLRLPSSHMCFPWKQELEGAFCLDHQEITGGRGWGDGACITSKRGGWWCLKHSPSILPVLLVKQEVCPASFLRTKIPGSGCLSAHSSSWKILQASFKSHTALRSFCSARAQKLETLSLCPMD